MPNPIRPTRTAFQTCLALLIAALGISGCQPALTPVPVQTPAVVAVQVSPSLQPLSEAMRECVEELDNTGLVLVDTPASAINLDAGLALRWGPPNPLAEAASVIGQEALVVILHPQNRLTSLALTDLQAIYQGQMQAWPGTTDEIQAWAYPPGDDVQQVFENSVLDGAPLPNNVTYTAPSPAAVIEAVAGEPGAIGFIPRRWLNEQVRAVDVEGLSADRLSQPILALSKSEPISPEKAWLLCLQERLAE